MPTTSVRAIEIFPTQIILLAGGKAVRIINVHTPIRTLDGLVSVVNDDAWLSESGSVITVKAAVINEVGIAMTISAPTTTEVILEVRQGIFLGAFQAHLTISGVYVHASDINTPVTGSRTAKRVDLGRPFILATQNSVMTIDHSTFRYLGRDWNSSYGLAWSKGSTGSISDSLLEHNFIGIYTDHSKGLQIQRNQFYYNSLYGVDPHSASSNLLVEYNTSNYNGRHGIIFSDHVTNGIVRYNTTIGNGLNGIMMDEASTGNKIDHNTVRGNKSDGIVMADSGNNDITYNTVSGNRVGIHVRGVTSTNLSIVRNTVSKNSMAAQGTSLRGNHSYGNGGQWASSRIFMVWVVTIAILLLLFIATHAAIRTRHVRRPTRHQLGIA